MSQLPAAERATEYRRRVTIAQGLVTDLRAFLAATTGTDGGRHDHLLADLDLRARYVLGALDGLVGPAPLVPTQPTTSDGSPADADPELPEQLTAL